MRAEDAFTHHPIVAELRQAPRLAVILGPRVALGDDAPADELAVLTALAGADTGRAVIDWMRRTGLPLPLLPLIGLAAARLNGVAGPSPARHRLAQLFADTAPGPVHHALAALAREHGITAVALDWHGRLRRALDAAGAPTARIHQPDDAGQPGIVEPLGSVDRPDGLVLSTGEQARAFGHGGPASRLLARIFETHAVLLVGAEPLHPALAGLGGVHPRAFLAFGHGPTLGWQPLAAPRGPTADDTAVALLRAIGAGRRPPSPPPPPTPVELSPSARVALLEDLERIGPAVGLTPARAGHWIDVKASHATWEALVAAALNGASPRGEGWAAVRALLVEGVQPAAPGNSTLAHWITRLTPGGGGG